MLIQKYVRELYCKHILENAIGKKFTKIRPLWLTMGTSRLELDMYNQELNLALEHNGEQNVTRCFYRPWKCHSKLVRSQL
jgi:hypothetical protein